MKNKNFIIGLAVFVLFSSSLFFISSKNNNNEANVSQIEENTTQEVKKQSTANFEFLKAIKGVSAKNITLIDNPVGVEGEFLAPRDAILNGVDYFLKNTKNDKIEEISIDIGDGFVDFSANYKVNDNIKTPVKVRILPKLDDENNLVLNIDEVRFLDLKLADWLVDFGVKNVVKDIFSKNSNLKVEFGEGFVIIYKENFEQIELKKLEIKTNGLSLDMFINLEKIM